MRLWKFAALCLSLLVMQRASAAELVAVPPQHDTDLRFFGADGTQLQGLEALRHMSSAGLVVWVAGNQFFAMPTVIGEFQKFHPGISVGLMTLPPGLILQAIQQGGWTYDRERFPLLPDVYGSVSLDQLRATGRAQDYVIYMHNALELMVAKGNPKHVQSLADLTRADLKVTLPNPINEGIMEFYGKPLLTRLGLWSKLSPGADCAGCDPVPHVHFATVHHREIPARIQSGAADVGLVWRTEVLAAQQRGDAVEGVPLAANENAADQVLYVAGTLAGARHPEPGRAFLSFLISPAGQDAYGTYGFLPAAPSERHIQRAGQSR